MQSWPARLSELSRILALDSVTSVLADEADYRGYVDPDQGILLDLALDLGAQQQDTSQADLQGLPPASPTTRLRCIDTDLDACRLAELFDSLARAHELILSPEDFKTVSTLSKSPQSCISLVRCLLAPQHNAWIMKSTKKRWCAQMIGVGRLSYPLTFLRSAYLG